MSTLKIQGIENALGEQGYLTSPAGLTVLAYPASEFPSTPTSASFSPRQTPVATTTTASDGTASLTGLSSVSYAVCIVDQGGQPHFFTFPATYPGDGIAHVCRYVPAPYAAPVIPNFFVGFLKPGIQTHALGAFGDPNACRLPIAPLVHQDSGAFLYEGMVTNPMLLKFSAGDALIPLSLAGWYWPDFSSSKGPWDPSWTAFITNADGSESLFIVNAASPVNPAPFAQLAPAGLTTSATNRIQVGTDIVVPSSSSSSITTTAGGLYTVQLGLTLQGGSLS